LAEAENGWPFTGKDPRFSEGLCNGWFNISISLWALSYVVCVCMICIEFWQPLLPFSEYHLSLHWCDTVNVRYASAEARWRSCPSARFIFAIFQAQNSWADFHDFLYERCAIGDHPNGIYFNSLHVIVIILRRIRCDILGRDQVTSHFLIWKLSCGRATYALR
jgi:hypothetical protein